MGGPISRIAARTARHAISRIAARKARHAWWFDYDLCLLAATGNLLPLVAGAVAASTMSTLVVPALPS